MPQDKPRGPVRATPAPKPPSHRWYSVDARYGGVLKEYRIPVDPADRNPIEKRLWQELQSLAEQHRTYVRHSPNRRG